MGGWKVKGWAGLHGKVGRVGYEYGTVMGELLDEDGHGIVICVGMVCGLHNWHGVSTQLERIVMAG